MTFSSIFKNYILNVALISWVAAQLIKTILTLIKTKKFNFERMFGAGGMPSAHTAAVCSMVIAVSRHDGFASSQFAIAFLLAAIVMYDATGVRRSAGEQAKIINEIVKTHNDADEDDENIEAKELKESLGHTPLEVLGGALLGILIAVLVPMG